MSAMRQHWLSFWQQRSRREQLALAAAATVLAVGIAWGTIWEPAQTARIKLGKRNTQLATQVVQMQALIQEAAALRGRAKAIAPPEQMKARLQAAFAAQGIKLQRLEVDGNHAQVQAEAPFEACLAVADTVRMDTRWALVQARFEATPTAGVVRAQMGWGVP